MLSEAEALALLTEHCRPLEAPFRCQWRTLNFRPRGDRGDLGRDAVDVSVWPKNAPIDVSRRNVNLSVGRDIGARLRLALAVAQAVASCRGYAPLQAQRFWRRVVDRWRSINRRPVDAFAASSTLWDHVGIAWKLSSITDKTFWFGFVHGTPECIAALASVLETLRPHLSVDELPRCRDCACRSCVGYQAHMEHIVGRDIINCFPQALLDPLETPWPAATHVGLVIEYSIDDNAYLMRETLDLLGQTRAHPELVSIDRFVLHLAPPVPPRRVAFDPHSRRAFLTRIRELGYVLRALVVGNGRRAPRVPTVVLHGCSQTDYRLVGAALSAVTTAGRPTLAPRVARVRTAEDCVANVIGAIFEWDRSLRTRETLVGRARDERFGIEGRVQDALHWRFGPDLDTVRVEYLGCGSTVRLAPATPARDKLESLLMDFAIITSDDLTLVLAQCWRLQTLVLDG